MCIRDSKHTKDEHTDLSALADSALQQIEAKKYDTELRDNGVNSIISIGTVSYTHLCHPVIRVGAAVYCGSLSIRQLAVSL